MELDLSIGEAVFLANADGNQDYECCVLLIPWDVKDE